MIPNLNNTSQVLSTTQYNDDENEDGNMSNVFSSQNANILNTNEGNNNTNMQFDQLQVPQNQAMTQPTPQQ